MTPPAPERRASPFVGAACVAIAYLAIAGLWFGPAQAYTTRWPAWAFVAVSTVLIAALVQALMRRRRRAVALEREAMKSKDRTLTLLTAMSESSTDAIFAKDREGRYLFFNAAAARAMSTTAAQVLGRDDHAVFSAGQAAMIRTHDEQVMAGDRTTTFEEELDTAQGRVTYLAIKEPLHDENGRVVGLFGISRDITERRRAEESLRVSELRYRLAASQGQVWDWDVAHGRIDIADGFWLYLGMAPPAAGENLPQLQALMHPEDRPRWRDALHEHIVRQQPYDLEFRARHADGDWRWFHTQGQAVCDAQGRATYMAGTTFDITARKRAEAALRESDAALRAYQAELSELTRRLLAQEKTTTQRIAQLLHDQLGQTLAVARLSLDAMMGDDLPQRLETQGARVSGLVDQAVREVREVLVDLRPPLLEEHGLAAALDNEIRERGRRRGGEPTRVDTLLEVADGAAERRWPVDVEYSAFMVAREAIVNSHRHANATLIRVALGGTAETLTLEVTDDGQGIPLPLTRGRAGHLGIVGMRERAHAIDAIFTVENEPSGGTRVRLHWAAHAAAHAQAAVSPA